ncbi:MAG: hypothetical protein FWE59_00605 [Oscillospiraceae bacterium]|nr:hypothetical protein [Oscillospiraceae bacterium]
MRNRASVSGGVSVLIILLMIALSAFALLALYSARSNYLLAEKNANWINNYYKLDASAREAVGCLESVARDFPKSDGDISDADLETVAALNWEVLSHSPLTVTQTVSRDTAHLTVTLSLKDGGAGGIRWDVLSWLEFQDRFDYNVGQNIITEFDDDVLSLLESQVLSDGPGGESEPDIAAFGGLLK